MNNLSTQLVKLALMFTSLWMLCLGTAQAYSPEYITHATRGRVKYVQAQKYVSLVHRYALLNDLDPSLIFRLIRVESGYNEHAVSPRNARGLMQVVTKYHQDKIQGRDIRDPEVNIEVGVAILKEFIGREGSVARGLQAYEGNRKSNKYVRMVDGVRYTQYEAPYPGSDDREINIDLAYTEPSTIPNFNGTVLSIVERLRLKHHLAEKRDCLTDDQGIRICKVPQDDHIQEFAQASYPAYSMH
jgi:hypothetical protein